MRLLKGFNTSFSNLQSDQINNKMILRFNWPIITNNIGHNTCYFIHIVVLLVLIIIAHCIYCRLFRSNALCTNTTIRNLLVWPNVNRLGGYCNITILRKMNMLRLPIRLKMIHGQRTMSHGTASFGFSLFFLFFFSWLYGLHSQYA